MEEWLYLSNTQKMIDIFLVLLFFGIVLTFVAFFIKFTKAKKISKSGIEFEEELKENKDVKEIENTNSNNVYNNNIDLLHHRFFKLMILTQTKGYLLRGEDTDKHRINTEFLQNCFFLAFYEEVKTFFENVQANNGENLYRLTNVIKDIVIKANSKARLLNVELTDGSIIRGIPEIYLTKFAKWNNKYILAISDSLCDILSDSFHSNWVSKSIASLDSLYLCCSIIINDAERTLEYLNGNLEKEIEQKKNRWLDEK